MKKIIFTAVVAAAIISFGFTYKAGPAHTNTGVTTLHPEVASFDEIDIDFPLKAVITIKSGAKPDIALSGDEDRLNDIKVKVRDNRLVISSQRRNYEWNNEGQVTAQITLPVMTALAISGAAKAETVGKVQGTKFSVNIAGSGSATIEDMSVSSFSTDVSGSGKIIVNAGTAAHSSYDISGSGKINAFPLRSKEVEISISGSGKTEVTVSEKLDVSIYGSGIAYYKGHPAAVKKNIVGAGSLRIAD